MLTERPPLGGHMTNAHLSYLKNRHRGQRAFVVGSGPSLLKMDLTLLINEILFGSNQIYQYYPYGLPPVTYYHVGDPVCIPKREADRAAGYDVDNVGERFYRKAGCFCIIENLPNAQPYTLDGHAENYDARWTQDITDFIAHGYSITTESLAFAIYMGCDPIYLIGLDCSYPPGTDGHIKFFTDKVFRCHRIIRKYCEDSGCCKIFNASVGGLLDVYERVYFDSLFENNQPSYAQPDTQVPNTLDAHNHNNDLMDRIRI